MPTPKKPVAKRKNRTTSVVAEAGPPKKPKRFIDRVQERCVALKMSLDQLAKRIDIKSVTIGPMLLKRVIPKDKATPLAKALGVSVADLRDAGMIVGKRNYRKINRKKKRKKKLVRATMTPYVKPQRGAPSHAKPNIGRARARFSRGELRDMHGTFPAPNIYPLVKRVMESGARDFSLEDLVRLVNIELETKEEIPANLIKHFLKK